MDLPAALALVLCYVALVTAYPPVYNHSQDVLTEGYRKLQDDYPNGSDKLLLPQPEKLLGKVENSRKVLVRERRLTCDLFSFSTMWFSPRHTACTIKCLTRGRRGGTCRDGICRCRR